MLSGMHIFISQAAVTRYVKLRSKLYSSGKGSFGPKQNTPKTWPDPDDTYVIYD